MRPLRRITLNAAELEIGSARLVTAHGRGEQRLQSKLDAANQTAELKVPHVVQPGRYALELRYRGKIYKQPAGLFALDYEHQGRKRALFTQFEPGEARRLFPGWDEPGYRTPFRVAVEVPTDKEVVSNMPAAWVEPKGASFKIVHFQPTPPMSSYLLFVAVGDFERISRRVGSLDIGVVTKSGDTENGRWALEGEAHLLPWYERYFGLRYPLPKLDTVAGPGRSQFFTAMENWGAIFVFENVLLLEPSEPNAPLRQRIFGVAAHEMAHQWFGNLVTLRWWDDLWLNEGFATWMAGKATQALHPEWEPELARPGNKEKAFALDSLPTSHAIVQRVSKPAEISQAFDAITYQKSEAVIRMLEAYVGPDAWRRGVQHYLRVHRFSNAASEDLWESLSTASPKPIVQVARSFVNKPGVPLVRVRWARCASGKTKVALGQSRFVRGAETPARGRWRLPVHAAILGTGEAVDVLLSRPSALLTLPGCGTIVVNEGQKGYFRTLYAPQLLAALASDFHRLSPIDQLGLLNDVWSLGLAGYSSPSAALAIIQNLKPDAHPSVVARAAAILLELHRLSARERLLQERVAHFAADKFAPLLARLDWAPKAAESASASLLRSDLIASLGEMGVPPVLAESERQADLGNANVGALTSVILAAVAINSNEVRWTQLREKARREQNAVRRDQLYRQLALPRDEHLARIALQLALTDEPGVSTSAEMIKAVGAQHPDLAFAFAVANRRAVEALLEPAARPRFIPSLAASGSNADLIAALNSYASHELRGTSRVSVDRSIAEIRDRIYIRRVVLPQIAAWLSQQPRTLSGR